MDSTFKGAEAFNQDISNWDITSVTDFDSMFNGATAFDKSLCWDASGGTVVDMFTGSSGSTTGSNTC